MRETTTGQVPPFRPVPQCRSVNKITGYSDRVQELYSRQILQLVLEILESGEQSCEVMSSTIIRKYLKGLGENSNIGDKS
jgi:hypothetical protein